MAFSRTTISASLRCTKRRSQATRTNYNSQFRSANKTLLMGHSIIKDNLRKLKDLKTNLKKLKSMFALQHSNTSKLMNR